MGKPAPFPFDVQRWRADIELQRASMAAQGVWFNMLCVMWTQRIRGVLVGTRKELCGVVKCTPAELDGFLRECREYGFGNISKVDGAVDGAVDGGIDGGIDGGVDGQVDGGNIGKLMIVCRYMYKVGVSRKAAVQRQLRYKRTSRNGDRRRAANPVLFRVDGQVDTKIDTKVDEIPLTNAIRESVRVRKGGCGGKTFFVPPTLAEVEQRCRELGYLVNPERFHAHYASVGWIAGKSKITDWKQRLALWNTGELDKKQLKQGSGAGTDERTQEYKSTVGRCISVSRTVPKV